MSTFPSQPTWPLSPQASQVVEGDERQNALMAALNPPQAEAIAPQIEGGYWGEPQPGQPEQQPEDEPGFGELPGEGYLYPRDIEARMRSMVQTNPEAVRVALLRGIEVAAFAAQLPFSENKPSEWGHMALMFSQAYLLLDPSVDQQGVPVNKETMVEEGHHGTEESTQPSQPSSGQPSSQGSKQTTSVGKGAQGRPKPITTGGEKGHATFRREVTAHGHVEPPRVAYSPAEEALRKKHEDQIMELRGARGDLPRPIYFPGAGSSV